MNLIAGLKNFFCLLSSRYSLLVIMLWVTILASTTLVLVKQPFPGFTVKLTGERVTIDKIYSDNPALHSGMVIQAVTAPGADPVVLHASNSPFDPNTVAKTFSRFNQLLEHNRQVATLFSSPPVQLITPHKTISLELTTRPLQSFPLAYWATAISVLFSSLIAVGILSARRRDLAARLLATSAILFMLLSMFTSAYTHRILFLDPPVFEFYLSIQHLFGNTFSFAMLSMMCIYPQRLIGRKLLIFLLFVEPLLFWLNDQFQWVLLPLHTYFFNSFLAFLLFVVAASVQVYLSRRDPLSTAQIRWFLMSFFTMPVLDIFLYLLPVALDKPPIIPLWVVQMSFIISFIGLSLGIARYRLFDVERWWFKTWIWLLAGILLVIIDISLLAIIPVDSMEALVLSVVIVAWLYFPVRQWIWEKIAKAPDTQLENYLPMLAESVFNSEAGGQSAQCWKHCLEEIFQPITVEASSQPVEKPRIDSSGLSLLVPNIYYPQESIKLSGRNKGTRLFHKDDPTLASAVNQMISTMLSIKNTSQQAAQQERHRIMRDLHDDVGANILSMIYRAENETQAQYARDTLKLLRESIYALDDTKPTRLDSAIFQWQQDAIQRTQDAKVKLIWQDSRQTGGIRLNARQKINTGRALREVISNALQHAQAKQISITLNMLQQTLVICIENDGEILPLSEWVEGKGIHNIKTRIKELGGEVTWQTSNQPKRLRVEMRLPLDSKP